MLRRALIPFAFFSALLLAACGGSQSRPAPSPEPGGGAGGAATGGAQTRTTQARPAPSAVDSSETIGGVDEDDGDATTESVDTGGTDDATRDVTRMMSDLTQLEGSLDAVELGASPQDCETGRVLVERICELAERVCRLEGELGGRCQDARARCQRGRDRLSQRCE